MRREARVAGRDELQPIAYRRPSPRPEPLVRVFGFAFIDWHFGMWRSAAFWLKRRPQCGQPIRDMSGPDGIACAEHFRQLGPNGLEFEKETTHDLLSSRRRASMA